MTSISILEAACAGLLMPSESDYPLETFVWPTTMTTGGGGTASTVLPISATQLLQRIGQDDNEDTLVELTTLDDLFANIAFEQDWYDDIQRQQVVRFQALLQTIRAQLGQIQVFRVGTIDIQVYIIGRLLHGSTGEDDMIGGIKTKLVET
jgi:Nuclease A inhibitor-like protein